MNGFLLDTNVLSELRRPSPNRRVGAFVAAQKEQSLWVSEVTFAEIRFGIEQVPDPNRRAALNAWLATTLRPLFNGRTLPVSEDVLVRWRLMVEAGRKRGHTFPQPDLFIAATAADAGLIVASRDVEPFIAARTSVFDPWSSRYFAENGEMREIGGTGAHELLI